MADEPRIVISSEPSLGIEEVAHRTFPTSFRGYDPAEVRAFLRRVADEISALREREADLRRRLDESQRRAATPPPLDESTLMAALGEETARVLRSAREAAAEITRKAEQKVAAIVREAQEEAARLREEAEGLLARRTEEAEEAAAALRAEAESEAAAILARARAEADALLEEARATGRSMVQEAQSLRERVLADLARRRRLAQVHVEQLRAGRDRLLDAYRVVRRTLDEVTDELGRAEVEARAAAEEAGRRAAAGTGTTLHEVEAELAAARAELTEGAVDHEGTGSSELGREAELPGAIGIGVSSASDVGAPVGAAAAATSGERAFSRHQPRTVRLSRGDGGDDVELPVVEVPGDEEAVRVLHELPGRGAPPDGVDEQRPAEPAHEDDPGRGLAAASPETAAASVSVEPGVQGAPPPGRDIDELFARIRADRARAVAEAAAVLAAGEAASAEVASAEVASAEGAACEAAVETPDGDEASVGPPADGGGRGVPDVSAVEPTAVADDDEVRLQRRDQLLEPLEAALVRRLKRALQDEQNAVLDALRTRRGAPRAEEVLPEPTRQADAYASEAVSILGQAAEAGAIFAGGTAAHAAGVGVEPVAAELTAEVVAPLRERVARALAGLVDDGSGDATESINSAYREWRLQRVEPAARHAVATAFALGSYAAQPDGTAMRWVVDDEGQPCPDCDDNALAGATVKGEPFPTGQRHPPAHPGCRCLLVPAEG